MIPKIIFQTWKTKKISSDLAFLINSWKKNNPNFEYRFFDDKECEVFLKSFNKRIFESYKKIIPGAFKADLWRFCVLYVFGGFYCDIDTLCLGKIDNFIKKDTNFIVPIDLNLESKIGHNLFNSFIGSIPQSKIMKNCIDIIVHNVENNITNIPALDFSSCGVLGKATNRFLNLKETNSFIGKEGFLNNIHFLKFEKNNQYIKDINDNILFQNKHGNQTINKIYQKECKESGVVSWFYSKNWIKRKIFL